MCCSVLGHSNWQVCVYLFEGCSIAICPSFMAKTQEPYGLEMEMCFETCLEMLFEKRSMHCTRALVS